MLALFGGWTKREPLLQAPRVFGVLCLRGTLGREGGTPPNLEGSNSNLCIKKGPTGALEKIEKDALAVPNYYQSNDYNLAGSGLRLVVPKALNKVLQCSGVRDVSTKMGQGSR